jgi:hypothetical protein
VDTKSTQGCDPESTGAAAEAETALAEAETALRTHVRETRAALGSRPEHFDLVTADRHPSQSSSAVSGTEIVNGCTARLLKKGGPRAADKGGGSVGSPR